jgi:hypothetical protein
MPDRPQGFFRRNGLSLAFAALFLASLGGHVAAGWLHANHQREHDGAPAQPIAQYLRGGEFWSSVLENWESEFLQMGLFVLVSVKLRQHGSPESRPFSAKQEARERRDWPAARQPWAARRAGWIRRLYENSLSIALLALFAASFVAHWFHSWRAHVEEKRLHGEPPTPLREYLFDAEFWFQSMQNWQSEFLAIAALVLLSVWLRQKDSPQSKQVEAPHSHTGH